MNLLRDTKLIGILLLGAVLRAWNPGGMNFHHDELSALLRCRFDNLTDLINFGVIPDGHPALTQVFLWFWTNLVGTDPFMVKLPFILAGIVSIWLVFQLATLMFDRSTGYVSAMLFSVMQYAVVYAQWARPYAFGVLFVLLGMYFMEKNRKENQTISLLGYVIAAALAAYTHYFALLVLLIYSLLSWILVLRGRQRLYLFSAGLAAFLFWVPHLSITLHHLSLGGIGDWLQPPQQDFWMSLLAYSFHYNVLFIIPIAFSAVFYLSRLRTNRAIHLQRLILLLSIAGTYLIAYFYSVNVSALLHYGTMAFAAPLLFVLVASLIHGSAAEVRWAIIAFYGILGTYTLIEERDHFELNYKTAYGDPFEWSSELNIPLHYDLREDAVDLLQNQSIAGQDIVSFNEIGLQNWDRYLAAYDKDELLVVTNAGSEPEVLASALMAFPCVKSIHGYHTTAAYLISRSCDADPLEKLNVSGLRKNDEYSPSIRLNTEELSSDDLIVLQASLDSRFIPSETKLVIDLGEGDKNLYWDAIDLFPNGTESYVGSSHLDLRDYDSIGEHLSLKSFIWNRSSISAKNVEISAWKFMANPQRYRLFEE